MLFALFFFITNAIHPLPLQSPDASLTVPFAGTPQLTSPADQATLDSLAPVTLTWQSPSTAGAYQLRVTPQSKGGPSIDVIVTDAAQVSAATFVIQPTTPGDFALLSDTTYVWQVRTSSAIVPLSDGDSMWSAWSTLHTFRTPVRSGDTITTVSPQSAATTDDTNVALRWQNAATDVSYYEVQFGDNAQLEGAPITVVNGARSNPTNSWAPSSLEQDKTYFWRVRPHVESENASTTWSATFSFTTPAPPPPPPTHAPTVTRSVSPATASAVQSSSAAPSSPAVSVGSPVEQQVLALINQIRQSRGLSTLSQVSTITFAARAHSVDMASSNVMSHTGTDGSNAGVRLTRAGYQWRMYGEIVARGYKTAQAVVDGWMNSPGHRDVILTPQFTSFGAALATSASGQSFWTVDFGLR